LKATWIRAAAGAAFSSLASDDDEAASIRIDRMTAGTARALRMFFPPRRSREDGDLLLQLIPSLWIGRG
jgi:hypothetical protein